MELVERVREAYDAGQSGRWSHVIGSAYGHASLNAVGTPEHSELRREFNEIIREQKKKPYGILEKIPYRCGMAVEYLMNP